MKTQENEMNSGVRDGGRDRDRTCDPFGVNDFLPEESGDPLGKEHFIPWRFRYFVLFLFRTTGSLNLGALR